MANNKVNWSGCRLVTRCHPFEHALCDFCAQVHTAQSYFACTVCFFERKIKTRRKHPQNQKIFPQQDNDEDCTATLMSGLLVEPISCYC